MSQFTRFLKPNKKMRENTKFAPTQSLTDENGMPLEWTIKPLTSKENEELRDKCTVDTSDGKSKLDFTRYKALIICASVVEPSLHSADILDSYGVNDPEELIYEMIDNPGEFNKFAEFIFEFNNFNNDKEKIEEVKK